MKISISFSGATVIAALVLLQIPAIQDLFGIALVMAGVTLHRPAA